MLWCIILLQKRALSAERLAVTEAVDMVYYLGYILSQVLYNADNNVIFICNKGFHLYAIHHPPCVYEVPSCSGGYPVVPGLQLQRAWGAAYFIGTHDSPSKKNNKKYVMFNI